MKRRITPDYAKARALIKLAQQGHQRLRASDVLAYPSLSLVDYYEIIHKYCEAICLCDGLKFSGEGAHKELLSYVAKNYFGVREALFLDELRDYRNRINYEGYFVRKKYFLEHQKKIEEIIHSLIAFSNSGK